MDLIAFVTVSLVFTAFGYFCGRHSHMALGQNTVAHIVVNTMDSLEQQGFLRTEMINGKLHYIKWPSEIEE